MFRSAPAFFVFSLSIGSIACAEKSVDTGSFDTADTAGASPSEFLGNYVGPLSIEIDMADGPTEICTGAVALGVDANAELVGAGACALTFGYADATMRLSFGGEVLEDGLLSVTIGQRIEATELGEDEWLLPTGQEYPLDGQIVSGSLDAHWSGALYTAFGEFDFSGEIIAE
jgi:hypothetical protein